ncbi:hypothetical protein JJB99_21720 [Bradyrhizobium diazoefficiens]|nr:hypothetical protein JJB99_21720 [Bradyrhizobium diazoefficiens]
MRSQRGAATAVPRGAGGTERKWGYFSDELIEPNFLFGVEPRLLMMAMIASAIPAPIRPYSIAVAPDSLARKPRMVCMVSPEFEA